jgi:biotin transport system substrate-specific component
MPALRALEVLAASLFVALCSHLSLPLFFTPVPLTLQPFAVLLVGLLLPPGTAFLALALYLLEGAAGLPVFTPGGLPGAARLLGPTAGYLLAYPAAGALVAALARRFSSSRPGSPVRLAAAAALGDALILAAGALWFAALTRLPMAGVLGQAVVPFLPGEALKVVTAAAIAASWLRFRARPRPAQP